jgi:hypothetical protein
MGEVQVQLINTEHKHFETGPSGFYAKREYRGFYDLKRKQLLTLTAI